MQLFTNTVKVKILLPVFQYPVTVSRVSRLFCKSYSFSLGNLSECEGLLSGSVNRHLISSELKNLNSEIFNENVRGCRGSATLIFIRAFSTIKPTGGDSRLDCFQICKIFRQNVRVKCHIFILFI